MALRLVFILHAKNEHRNSVARGYFCKYAYICEADCSNKNKMDYSETLCYAF